MTERRSQLGREVDRFEAALAVLESDARGADREARTRAAIDFPAAYRRLCQRLAELRDGAGADADVARINALAIRGQAVLYREERSIRHAFEGLAALFWRFPALLWRHPAALAASVVLYVGSLLVVFAWVRMDPDAVVHLLTHERILGIEEMYAPDNALAHDRGFALSVEMWGFYIWNNIGIDLRTFGAGLLGGVPVFFTHVFNGVMHGAVMAHLSNAELGAQFWPFVVGHSSFEIAGLIVAGVAGLHIGTAWIAPGARGRALALRESAVEAVPLVVACIALTFVAAFVEAFWSPLQSIPAGVRYAVGGTGWALLVVWISMGRGRDAG
jgi:uncharacterized membrane protein SpoIIM required for sporulation